MRYFKLIAFFCLYSYGSEALALTADFTSRSAWLNAVNARTGAVVTTDPFNRAISAADSIVFDTGVVSTNSRGGRRASAHNLVLGGFYENAVGSGRLEAGSLEITWTFPSPVFAVAADWASIAPNRRVVLLASFDGATETEFDLFSLIDPNANRNTGASGFFGFVSSTAVRSLVLTGRDPQRVGDGFRVDNLSFATAPGVSVVPTPATLPLLMSTMAALALLRRRSPPA